MKTFAQLIDDARARAGDPDLTDNAIALRIGSHAVAVHEARHRGHVSDPLAIALARFLGLPIAQLVNQARAERERDPELRVLLCEWHREACSSVAYVRAIRDPEGPLLLDPREFDHHAEV